MIPVDGNLDLSPLSRWVAFFYSKKKEMTNIMVVTLLAAFFLIRLYTLYISINNAKALIVEGAKEYGQANSKGLAATHILIYVGAAIEAMIYHTTLSFMNIFGLILLILSYLVLFHVIRTLGRIWTLKIFILPHHPIVKSGLYKITKHPNYFLNIVPELIGVLLLTGAKVSWLLLLPYAFFLFKRIKQEEKLMESMI